MKIEYYEIWQEHGKEYELERLKKGVYRLLINGIITAQGTKKECMAYAL